MITKEQQLEDIKHLLGDRWYRLNNLYWIVDEHGVKMKFRCNWFQMTMYRFLWYLSIVLKARQVGITTFVCILFLDDVLFMKNISAAIIADTREHAAKIFDNKIKFAWDNLPDWLQGMYSVDADSSNMLKFSKTLPGGQRTASSIEVATSVRSGTYQRLLVTEFGKICAKHPEKAREIVTGALNTIHQGEIAIIESTAEGQSGYFFDFCQKARSLEASGVKLTKLDYKFFFFPWWQVPHYRLMGDFTLPREMTEYFNDTELKLGVKLDREQRNWYFKKSEQQGENMKREYPSYPDEAFEAAVEGAYYGKELMKMREQKRVMAVPHDPLLPVFTAWDLGMNDTMVILFIQIFNNQIRIIDCYRNSGEGLAHYAAVLRARRDDEKYNYAGHYGPHDLEVRELGTGKSRFDIAAQMGVNFIVVPRLSVQDGIEAVRAMMPRVFIDEYHCLPVVNALASYRKAWDDKLGTWKSEPFHDENSHVADALRYAAIGISSGVAGPMAGEPRQYSDRVDIQQDRAQDSAGFDPHEPLGNF